MIVGPFVRHDDPYGQVYLDVVLWMLVWIRGLIVREVQGLEREFRILRLRTQVVQGPGRSDRDDDDDRDDCPHASSARRRFGSCARRRSALHKLPWHPASATAP